MKFPKTLDVRKLFWYLNWLNFHPKSQPEGSGNLRYKIWNPADHWNHYFINWRDKSEGIFTMESLDLGEDDRKTDTIRHAFLDCKSEGHIFEVKKDETAYVYLCNTIYNSFGH